MDPTTLIVSGIKDRRFGIVSNVTKADVSCVQSVILGSSSVTGRLLVVIRGI